MVAGAGWVAQSDVLAFDTLPLPASLRLSGRADDDEDADDWSDGAEPEEKLLSKEAVELGPAADSGFVAAIKAPSCTVTFEKPAMINSPRVRFAVASSTCPTS